MVEFAGMAPAGPEPSLVWRCVRCHDTLPPRRSGEGFVCPTCDRSVPHRNGVLHFEADFEPEGFAPDRQQHLTSIEDDHFWFPPRMRLLGHLLTAVDTGAAALELGCGGGGFLGHLAARFTAVVGVDAYADSLGRARRRAPTAILAAADVTNVPLADAQFDLVVALDVLEHVDSNCFLREAHRLCRPGGALLLSVPAFPCLWSNLDKEAGHRCRYRRRQLHAELEQTGWRLEHWTHYQALLFPLVFVSRRLPGRRLHSVERRPGRITGQILGAINQLEVALFARHSLPFGSSLCVRARKAA